MSVIEDAAQLDKANSISGNKMNDIDVVYTMWSNLKKTDGMVAGQVQIFNYFGNYFKILAVLTYFLTKSGIFGVYWPFWQLCQQSLRQKNK